MREEFGALVKPTELRGALARLLADESGLKRMGEAARAFAKDERFSDRASELARLLLTLPYTLALFVLGWAAGVVWVICLVSALISAGIIGRDT